MIAHLAYTVISLFLLLGILVTFFFWYENLNTPCEELNPPKFSFRYVLRAYYKLLFAHLYRFVCMARWNLRKITKNHPTPTPHPDKIHPIVLIHCLYGGPSIWIDLYDSLTLAGHKVLVFGYNSFSKDIDTAVEQLDTFLDTQKLGTSSKFIFIGHSLGGIIVRRWLQNKESAAKRTQAVITLASPHKGSKLAVFTFGKCGSALRPNSSFMQSIAPKTPAGIPCVAYASAADDMVLPHSALLPPQGWELHTTGDLNHLALIFDKEIHTELVKKVAELTKK